MTIVDWMELLGDEGKHYADITGKGGRVTLGEFHQAFSNEKWIDWLPNGLVVMKWRKV